jgi:uncharacterized YccA/Bax inhibitor family protein
MKSSNPMFRSTVFDNAIETDTDVTTARMTLQGTAHKALILLALVMVGVCYSWGMCKVNGSTPAMLYEVAMPYLWGDLGVGFIFCLITCFVPRWAWFAAPVYSVAEGVLLGALSALYAMGVGPAQTAGRGISRVIASGGNGLVFTAVGLTLTVFAVMLLLYSFRVLRATPAFTKGVIAATLGIALLYGISLVLMFFGVNAYLFNGGIFGIGLSLVVVCIAALNLILDFDLIEQGVRSNAPKYMEWYGAFGLMVTLIWLYIEILRLLSQLNRR